MTVKEIFGAFVFDRAIPLPEYGFDEEPVAWARERLGRAGLALRVGADLSTEWLEVPATVWVIDSVDLFRAMVVKVSQTAVYRHALRDEGYRLRAARAFRDLCDALAPTYAFFHTVPERDVAQYLDDVTTELALWPPRLASFTYPLWYVDRGWADEIRDSVATELPARNGVVVLGRDSLGEWL